jgi:hypothetical protein
MYKILLFTPFSTSQPLCSLQADINRFLKVVQLQYSGSQYLKENHVHWDVQLVPLYKIHGLFDHIYIRCSVQLRDS